MVLFVVSSFFYSYQGLSFSLSYPLRAYALTFIVSGSFLMVAASISYSKRSKNYV